MSDDSSHFQPIPSWADAAAHLDFEPRVPSFTAGCELVSLSIHVMDHRHRKLPRRDRSLQAHYDRFAVDQRRVESTREAKRLALEQAYGTNPRPITINRSDGRRYELGPEVDDTDGDGRTPAVVVWSDLDLVLLIASTTLDAATLTRIADSTSRLR